LTGIESQ